MRFRAIDDSGGALQYDPGFACELISVIAMLYNLRIQHQLQEVGRNLFPVEPQQAHDVEVDIASNHSGHGGQNGNFYRQQVVATFEDN